MRPAPPPGSRSPSPSRRRAGPGGERRRDRRRLGGRAGEPVHRARADRGARPRAASARGLGRAGHACRCCAASDSRSLLSFDELRERAARGARRRRPGAARRRRDRLPPGARARAHVQVTGLRGLTYPIRGLRRDAPVTGATYADWGRFSSSRRRARADARAGGPLAARLRPRLGREPGRLRPAAARPPPRRRRLPRATGSRTSPSPGTSGTRDGGLLGSQPLGRVIAAGRALHGGERGRDAACTC